MGLKIASGKGERASLIKALENMGLSAKTATKLVDGLARAVAGLHSKKISITTELFTVKHGATGVFGSNSSMAVGKAAASGTPSASRGMYLVGEQGPELMYMHGGEQIVPAPRTSDTLAALASAAASGGGGGGGTAEIHVHAHLDGKEVFKSVQTHALNWQTRNSGTRSGLLIPGTRVGGI
jgi:hypothetical protein